WHVDDADQGAPEAVALDADAQAIGPPAAGARVQVVDPRRRARHLAAADTAPQDDLDAAVAVLDVDRAEVEPVGDLVVAQLAGGDRQARPRRLPLDHGVGPRPHHLLVGPRRRCATWQPQL